MFRTRSRPRFQPMRRRGPALFAAVLVGAAMGTPAVAQAAVADPVSVIQQLSSAAVQHDRAAASALLTDNVVATGFGCEPVCVGKAAVVAAAIPSGMTITSQLVEVVQVSGNVITVRFATAPSPLPPPLAAAGIQRIMSLERFTVEDGKIAAWSSVFDVSDPQTQYFARTFLQAPTPDATVPDDSIARDGATLAMQSAETQALFKSTYDTGASARWAQEHNAAIAGTH